MADPPPPPPHGPPPDELPFVWVERDFDMQSLGKSLVADLPGVVDNLQQGEEVTLQLGDSPFDIVVSYELTTTPLKSDDDHEEDGIMPRRKVLLQVYTHDSRPFLFEADMTELFLVLFDTPFVEGVLCCNRPKNKCGIGLNELFYDFATICDALKGNRSLKSFKTYLLKINKGNGADNSGAQHLFRDLLVHHNKNLQEIHLIEVCDDPLYISSEHPCLDSYKGATFDCWADTLRELNLNKLGRRQLGSDTSTTTIADFVAMIDPKTIRSLVADNYSDFIEDSLEPEEHNDWYILANDASLAALNNNYNFLHKCLPEWIEAVYHELRCFNLLYGMLREYPLLWCLEERSSKKCKPLKKRCNPSCPPSTSNSSRKKSKLFQEGLDAMDEILAVNSETYKAMKPHQRSALAELQKILSHDPK